MNWIDILKKNEPKNLWFKVEDRMIHAHRWMHDEDITVVFIHGSLANCCWWQHIASGLNKGTIMSIDLSGHGLSEWDDEYSLLKHGEEVINLIRKFGNEKVYLFGHSYGGIVASYVATRIIVDEVILVDTPLHFTERRINIRQKSNVYPTIEDAVARFIPLPKQPIKDKVLLEWLAKRSIKEVEGGYTWQFDPKTLDRAIPKDAVIDIKERLTDHGIWWYGEHSPFVTELAIQMADQLGLVKEMIPNAHHAITLDAPELVLEKVKRIIGDV